MHYHPLHYPNSGAYKSKFSRKLPGAGPHKNKETLPLSEAGSPYDLFSSYLSFFAYFFLNRSTRPSVSMIFCVPVKNGWQFEQISTLISPPVDLVLYLLPQAQCTATSRYTGWIPFFIIHTPSTSQSSAFAYSKICHCTLSQQPDTSRILSIHRLQEFLIGLSAMQFVHQKLHGFHRPKRT